MNVDRRPTANETTLIDGSSIVGEPLARVRETGVVKGDFRKACGQFATGVTVVTVRDGEGTHGMTANSFTSVSLDPPLVLVSVDRARRTHDLLDVGDRFAVSVLADEHRHWSDRYAGRHGEAIQREFGDVPHRLTDDGLPLLEGALASFVCRVVSIHPAGDHSLFVGLVEHLEYAPGKTPLVFFTGANRTVEGT
jgi:flavin reductase (DIM6/NTAB) family NADH-FMN oxidoreductase RutF